MKVVSTSLAFLVYLTGFCQSIVHFNGFHKDILLDNAAGKFIETEFSRLGLRSYIDKGCFSINKLKGKKLSILVVDSSDPRYFQFVDRSG